MTQWSNMGFKFSMGFYFCYKQLVSDRRLSEMHLYANKWQISEFVEHIWDNVSTQLNKMYIKDRIISHVEMLHIIYKNHQH